MRVSTSVCERARAWVSIALDDELSELEQAILRAHLARCAECAAYASDTRAFTDAVRVAPLEPVPVSIALPHRRSRVAGSLRGVVAAGGAIAAAVSIGLATATTSGTHSGSDLTGQTGRSTRPVSSAKRPFGRAIDWPQTVSIVDVRPYGLRGRDDQP